uniref:ATP-dependent helicase C-terminal domain-containing protein n=1 Tax=Oceanicella sp. SM1341 TaxID=1548889 RepID=UPI002711DE83
ERIRAEATRLARHPAFRAAREPGEAPTPAGLASLAWPDRIGLRRRGDDPRYLLSGGKGAVLDAADPLAAQRMLVALDLDGDQREARIRLAAAFSEAEAKALHPDMLAEVDVCDWSRRERAVVARSRSMLGALVLEDRVWRDVPQAAVAAAMREGIARDLGLEALNWSKPARLLAARVEFLRGQGAEMPDMSPEGLLASLSDWLEPHLGRARRAADLGRIDLLGPLESLLDWEARQALDRLAPAHITAPTGTKLAVDWSGEQPSVSVRLQEMFGLTEHPVIGPKRLPLQLELLSPAGRPVQVTADLPGFWARSYADVRKDMRGRYPRHPWPEDPTEAEPTLRAKPRGT